LFVLSGLTINFANFIVRQHTELYFTMSSSLSWPSVELGCPLFQYSEKYCVSCLIDFNEAVLWECSGNFTKKKMFILRIGQRYFILRKEQGKKYPQIEILLKFSCYHWDQWTVVTLMAVVACAHRDFCVFVMF